MLKEALQGKKGITLIALIITIIVLLILAGVTIAQIEGNDSAPNKAVEARQKNEQGAEFDAIKLAAVSSIAEGDYDLYVDVPTLRTGLTGLIQEEPAEVITTGATQWTVTGNTGVKYLITNRGEVTIREEKAVSSMTLSTSSTLSIKPGRNATITVSSITPSTNVEDIVFEIDEDNNAAGAYFGTTENPTTSTTVAVGSDATASATINIPSDATVGNSSTVTIKGASSGAGSVTCTVTVAEPSLAVGSTVTYSTTLNNKDLTMDWKVFHKDGDYTWIILEDYLPNSYVNISTISKSNSYAVYSNNRTNLINAMKNTANWSSLLAGTLNGTEIALTDDAATDTNIKAMGSPTLELWIDSWNANHEGETNDLFINQNSIGYLVKKGSASGSSNYYVEMGNTGTLANLYFPHTSQWNSTNGYWLASPSANGTGSVMNVYYNGNVRNNDYDNKSCAFRPVVCLPSDVLE